MEITADGVSAVDDRHVSAAMLDFPSNMTSKRKLYRIGMSGMSISGGTDTKFEYLALLDPKLQTNIRSAAAILDFTLQ